MAGYPTLAKSLGGFAAASPLAFLEVYFVFHVVLGVSLSRLLSPSILTWIVTVALGPVLWLSWRRLSNGRNPGSLLTATILGYICIVGLIDVYYAGRFRLLDSRAVRTLSVGMIVFFGLIFAARTVLGRRPKNQST